MSLRSLDPLQQSLVQLLPAPVDRQLMVRLLEILDGQPSLRVFLQRWLVEHGDTDEIFECRPEKDGSIDRVRRYWDDCK